MTPTAPSSEKPPTIPADDGTIASLVVATANAILTSLLATAHRDRTDPARLAAVWDRVAWHCTEIAKTLRAPHVKAEWEMILQEEKRGVQRIVEARRKTKH